MCECASVSVQVWVCKCVCVNSIGIPLVQQPMGGSPKYMDLLSQRQWLEQQNNNEDDEHKQPSLHSIIINEMQSKSTLGRDRDRLSKRTHSFEIGSWVTLTEQISVDRISICDKICCKRTYIEVEWSKMLECWDNRLKTLFQKARSNAPFRYLTNVRTTERTNERTNEQTNRRLNDRPTADPKRKSAQSKI